jgi:hypothetical protein
MRDVERSYERLSDADLQRLTQLVPNKLKDFLAAPPLPLSTVVEWTVLGAPKAVTSADCMACLLRVAIRMTTRQALRKPLRSFGSTGNRNSGASVVVKAQTVMESAASKLSSWT